MATPVTPPQPIAMVTVAGAQALSMRLDMPVMGFWFAAIDVDIATSPAVGTLVDIVVRPSKPPAPGLAPLPSQLFLGTVMWGAPWQGRSRIEVWGGAGGLRTVLPPRAYTAGPIPLNLGDILADLVGAAGETLAAGVQSTLSGGSYTLTEWPRYSTTAYVSLTLLCRRFGLQWRTLDDGTVFVGPVTYVPDTSVPPPFQMDDDGQARVVLVAPDVASLRPDTTILGRKAGRVVYTVDSEGLRAEIYYLGPDGLSDRDDAEGGVRRLLPELPYMTGRLATITAVRSNTMIEVRCDDALVGEVDNVQMLAGTPEMTVTPQAGQRVVVWFNAASPDTPFALAWQQDPTATQGIGRVGDSVDCGSISATGGGTAPIVITWIPPGSVVPPGATAISGRITSGHPRVKLTSAS